MVIKHKHTHTYDYGRQHKVRAYARTYNAYYADNGRGLFFFSPIVVHD